MTDVRLQLPLVSERLLVRDLVPDDVEAMHAYASNDDVARYLFWGPNTFDETQAALAAFIAAQADDPRMIYELGIVLPGDQLVGALCLYLGDEGIDAEVGDAEVGDAEVGDAEVGDAEMGFVIHPDHWGKGLVVEAARLLMTAGFQRLGLQKIWATCDVRNEASIRVLEKLGMRRLSTTKNSQPTKNGRIDEHLYAVEVAEFSNPGASHT